MVVPTIHCPLSTTSALIIKTNPIPLILFLYNKSSKLTIIHMIIASTRNSTKTTLAKLDFNRMPSFWYVITPSPIQATKLTLQIQ